MGSIKGPDSDGLSISSSDGQVYVSEEEIKEFGSDVDQSEIRNAII